jgi:hypothetical protein
MFVCLSVIAASAQGTPEAALAELALAKDFKSAAKHYPIALVDALKGLPPQDLAVAKNELLPIKKLYGLNVTPKASEDDASLLVFDVPEQKRKFSLRVKRRLSDGVMAMLEMESCEEDKCWGEWRAWMKMEDGEWRLDELLQGWTQTAVMLQDPDLIARLQHAEMHHNEEAALESLQIILAAVSEYANTFKDIGFPEEINVLVKLPAKPGEQDESTAESEDAVLDPQHAQLLQEAYGKNPSELEGYRFEYTLLRHGRENTGSYSITATPLTFGKTGTRSFYVDESGVIKATKEERAATVTDSRLYGR